MMSNKRFTWKTEKLQHSDDEVIIVVDNANKDWKGHILNIVDLLNELSDDNRQLKKLLKGNNEKFGKCWDRIYSLEKENEQLRKIGVMYQGHNPCEICTYCLEDKLCCGINPPILCDEMKKDYFIYGLCKKHKQYMKSFRRYDDE